ncbi:MAG: ornithine cyclodeaminase family protein [Candidatus Limnocylindria bacterium]
MLTAREVEELLPMTECIELMRETFAGLARGDFFQPLRKIAAPPGAAGVLGSMPAYRAKPTPIFSLKALCVFPGNPSRGLDSHLGPVLVYDGSTGHLRGLMNGAAITAIRTPAASAVATDLLARADADDLAVIGAGVQARGHIEAICHVRTIRRVRVAGRDAERLQALVEWARGLLGCPVEVSATIEDALRDASIICTATNAKEPIVRRAWIADGAHLNVVGSSIATAREVDGATMAATTLFVDRAESTLNEGGDFLLAVAEGAIDRDHIHAELGEVLLGTKTGRTSDTEITLFKSLGLGSEDLAAADRVLAKAEAFGRGTVVPF